MDNPELTELGIEIAASDATEDEIDRITRNCLPSC
jgi:hypothetical protein